LSLKKVNGGSFSHHLLWLFEISSTKFWALGRSPTLEHLNKNIDNNYGFCVDYIMRPSERRFSFRLDPFAKGGSRAHGANEAPAVADAGRLICRWSNNSFGVGNAFFEAGQNPEAV
jgi:hypothetical protein